MDSANPKLSIGRQRLLAFAAVLVAVVGEVALVAGRDVGLLFAVGAVCCSAALALSSE